MSDYDRIDKTDWFIQKMRLDWFSSREIVEVAAKEFPDVPPKKLQGTIGQYWSDCVNPKWGTFKAIQARGLKVVESSGRRRIVERNGGSQVGASDAPERAPKSAPCDLRASNHPAAASSFSRELWNSNNRQLWQEALDRYWTFVKPANLGLEKEMDKIDVETVRAMGAQAWYEFLLEKYFRWKYTAPNRYASTTRVLKTYAANNELSILDRIKERLFAVDKENIQQCLAIATSIRGLSTAGASGLLAVLFPKHFATVDQFVVKALALIPDLPETHLIAAMHPESLTAKDGDVLIRIMRRKAQELNTAFLTTEWTPRKIDMVLWTCGR